MSLFYLNEPRLHGNYDNGRKPSIEVVECKKGERGEVSCANNEIVCFMEGSLRIGVRGRPCHKGEKGLLLLVTGETYTYRALEDARVIVFRLDNPEMLRKNLLSVNPGKEPAAGRESGPCPLPAIPRVRSFLRALDHSLSDGIRWQSFFDLKTRELFCFFRFYYPKEDIFNFFFPVLSRDLSFSEYVRVHWRRFHSVEEFAASMHLSYRQFYNRFIAVFGEKPLKWMRENLACELQSEIRHTDKPFKQIAAEYGFSSETHFTRFCRDTLGDKPTAIRDDTAVVR